MSDLYNHIGFAIKEARRTSSKRLITQSELANACNVTFQQIQKYEKATNKIPLDKLLTVSKYLKKPLSYFIPDQTPLDEVMIGQIETEQHSTSKT